LDSASKLKPEFAKARFLHVSTDEVYGSLGAEGFFTEESKYAPNSPYSASKASSDMIVRSYFKTYGLPVVITNCSNNYGPKQHGEKLIPTVIRKALSGQPIPIYGTGTNVRDWIFVKDHCEAVHTVFKSGRLGETYAIGGDCERTNLDLARTICKILDGLVPQPGGKSYGDQIQFVKDRLGHDLRYAIDAQKVRDELGFTPRTELQEGLKKTIEWYVEQRQQAQAAPKSRASV
jgi:dTDP-glucose 4,6-dehydratase